jgi:hypothetical protein
MPLKPLMTVLPLVAFVAAANVSTALSTPNSGSPHVMTNAPPPAGLAALPDRTPPLILAQETRSAEPRPRAGDASDSGQPAPAPSDENRDLDRRTSPEAANDLFQLLKQAGPKQPPKPK